jgi:hypothetical protein
MYFGDVVIRIEEDLDEVHIKELERDLDHEQGIYKASMHEKRRHLLLVDFDPDRVAPNQIVQSVRAHGLHAEMVTL